MKTTSLNQDIQQLFAVLYPGIKLRLQVSQSTGQDLVAFQVHPACLPSKFQQYFKFDRPSSLIQQQKPPGHKFTLAQGLVILESEIYICCNALKHQYQLSISLQHQIFGQQSTSCINTVDILFLDQNRFFKEISTVLVYGTAIKGWIFREFSVIFFPGLSGIEQFARITKSHHIRLDVSSCDLDLFAVQCLGGFPAGGCCNNREGKVYYSYHLRRQC